MRAIVVELAGPDDLEMRSILQGHAVEADRALGSGVERGVGSLATDGRQTRHDPEAGEPA
jgi:hypothetical protein